MATKKELLGSELMREIAAIRIDTMWNMLALKQAGRMPPIDAEKATGDLDDKGGMFMPAGLVLQDWEGKPIAPERYKDRTAATFHRSIRHAMRFDGVHLVDHDGIATCVKLGNTAFSRMAGSILENRREVLRRRGIGERPPARIGSAEMCKSYCPTYIGAPYGSRTSLSSDISVCLTEPRLFFRLCQDYYNLRGDDAALLWDGIKRARLPVLGADDVVLAPPYLITCHNTRYREPSLTGLTRISGFGKFGEFATFTLEQVSADLLHEIESGRVQISEDELVATHDGVQVVAILRLYPRTSPGARLLKGVSTMLVSPERDLGLDLAKITAEAKKRYGI